MININGNRVNGNNIIIGDGNVLVDGKDVTPKGKNINIIVDSDIDKLKVDVCNKIVVHKNCGSIETKNGNVKVKGDVTGDVSSINGDVRCGSIKGNLKTINGNINK